MDGLELLLRRMANLESYLKIVLAKTSAYDQI